MSIDGEQLQKELPVEMFLPHELFSTMYECDKQLWMQTFGTDEERAAYWRDLQEPWWVPSHPLFDRVMSDPSRAVPLRTHGDDGAFKKGLVSLTMMIYTIACPLRGGDWENLAILLVFSLLQQYWTDQTFDQMLSVVKWSLKALLSGKMPEADQHNMHLTGDRSKAAGNDIADGYYGVPTQHLGDLKFLKESFHQQAFYNKNSCCHLCACSKAMVGPGNFANFSDAGIEWFVQNMTTEEHFFAMFDTPGDVPHLARLTGFRLMMWLVDFMHSDLQGVGQWLLGNSLYIFAQQGRFGRFAGQWKIRINLALSHAYQAFKKHCADIGKHCRAKKFTVNMLGMTSDQCWPEFKGKAESIQA